MQANQLKPSDDAVNEQDCAHKKANQWLEHNQQAIIEHNQKVKIRGGTMAERLRHR